MSDRSMPRPSTRWDRSDAGSTGAPSVSTTCSPTRSEGRRRARSTASRAAGAATTRLAAVRTPSRCAASTASLTSRTSPKSSAVTMSRFKQRTRAPSGRIPPRPQELEELYSLAQPPLHHRRACDHLGHDGRDLGRAEIEFAVEVLDRGEDLGVAQVRVVQRRNLGAFLSEKIDFLVVQPAVLLGLAVQEGARIGGRERNLNRVGIDLLGEVEEINPHTIQVSLAAPYP